MTGYSDGFYNFPDRSTADAELATAGFTEVDGDLTRGNDIGFFSGDNKDGVVWWQQETPPYDWVQLSGIRVVIRCDGEELPANLTSSCQYWDSNPPQTYGARDDG